MTEVLTLIYSSFWTWLGTVLLLWIPFRLILRMWIRFMRMLSVRSKGWPPPHLDADGDFKPEKSDD